MDPEEIRQDIAAFADSEGSVIVHKAEAVFQRDGFTQHWRFVEAAGQVFAVDDGDRRVPYRRFLGEHLGRLGVMAQAIREKRSDVVPYVDTWGSLVNSQEEESAPASAADTLWGECQSKPLGETKLTFLTANAGQGKTAVLRRLARRFADAYSAGQTEMLLLHIDTQGRSFLRIEEAVARDLGQLRIAGLYYSGVLRLMRAGLLAIAVDGFDELLAEVGFGEAYSGLGAFLKQLGGAGCVIASARSAYFEVENYAAQSRLLTSLPGVQVSVQQMKLRDWEAGQAVEMLTGYVSPDGDRLSDPAGVYKVLSDRLGSSHPVLTTPFLVRQLAALLLSPSKSPTEIADLLSASADVVPTVIQALLQREVGEKWRDPNGQPYLPVEDHVRLLSLVADEMWCQGKGALPSEVVELIAEEVMDERSVPLARRVQIGERVKAHALLVPAGSPAGELQFEHDEFLNYFLALRLASLLGSADAFALRGFCEIRPLPVAVAQWAARAVEWSAERVAAVVSHLGSMCASEARSTYLRQNAGLVASQLAAPSGVPGLLFDSMSFEGSEWRGSALRGAEFHRCSFVNVDLSDAKWTKCRLTDCAVESPTLSLQTSLAGCVFAGNTPVLGVLIAGGGDQPRSYEPGRCRDLMERAGASFEVPPAQRPLVGQVPDERRGSINSFFRIFSRSSGATDGVIRMKLGARYADFSKTVLPAMIELGVLRETPYRGHGQQRRYELGFPIEEILRAEDPRARGQPCLAEFWERMRAE